MQLEVQQKENSHSFAFNILAGKYSLPLGVHYDSLVPSPEVDVKAGTRMSRHPFRETFAHGDKIVEFLGLTRDRGVFCMHGKLYEVEARVE